LSKSAKLGLEMFLTRGEVGSQIPDVSLSGDYLHSGGGFCMEESEIHGDACHPSSSSVSNSAEKCSVAGDGCSSALDCQTTHLCSMDDDDVSHSRDYLISGGGFCMDEKRDTRLYCSS